MSCKSVQDYHIAWIAALAIERSAAWEMLDEKHQEPDDFIRNPTDENSYDWGQIHSHHIVITSLPATAYGKATATHTITELLASLPQIKFGLMVGIGAGLPSPKHDIRLGDVVVSQPNGTHGGVVQYDLGKANADGTWELKGFLQPPPMILLKALSSLQAKHESGYYRTAEFLSAALAKNPVWAQRYSYPTDEQGRWLDATGISDGMSGETYVRDTEQSQTPRKTTNPAIHFGTIASGDTLIKDALTRDDILIKTQCDCLCVEMEAAGLLSKFPCMVIRGICDYANSSKNDDWQRYASATAAAFGKELLVYVPRSELPASRRAKDITDLSVTTKRIDQLLESQMQSQDRGELTALLSKLYTCPYEERKDRNPTALDGTCRWFLNHPRFVNFLADSTAKLLWVSADPGCGKSVLAKHLIDDVLQTDDDHIICYFFFKDDFDDQKPARNAISAALHQLLLECPEAKPQDIDSPLRQIGLSLSSFAGLWSAFQLACSNIPRKQITFVLDALDECETIGRNALMKMIDQWHSGRGSNNLKLIITSRPYGIIRDGFYNLLNNHPTIHLSGESDQEIEQISQEIDIVLRHRIRILSEKRDLTPGEKAYLIENVASVEHRTYLWAHLTMDIIETTPGLTRGSVRRVLGSLPSTVYQAYEKILSRSTDFDKTATLLHVLRAARRPLTVSEMNVMLSTAQDCDYEALSENMEPPTRFRRSIRDLCGLFVVIVNEHVYFLHQTVREFLSKVPAPGSELFIDFTLPTGRSFQTWINDLRNGSSHEIIAERCLWTLFTPKTRIASASFFEYCEMYWPSHFSRSTQWHVEPPQTELAMHVFLTWESKYDTLATHIREEHGLNKPRKGFYGPALPLREVSALDYAAYFGLQPVLSRIIQRSKQSVQSLSRALWLACYGRQLNTVESLISHGALVNINAKGQSIKLATHDEKVDGQTPLMYAISKAHCEFVDILAQQGAREGASNSCSDWDGREALGLLAKRAATVEEGHQIMQSSSRLCRVLLNCGISSADICDIGGRNALEIFLGNYRHYQCPKDVFSQEMIKVLFPVGQRADWPGTGGGPTLVELAKSCRYCIAALLEMG